MKCENWTIQIVDNKTKQILEFNEENKTKWLNNLPETKNWSLQYLNPNHYEKSKSIV